MHPKHLSDTPWHHWYVEHLDRTDFVLDLGCSLAAHAMVAARGVRGVVGVDYDAAALATAAAAVRRAGADNVSLLAVDLTGAFHFATRASMPCSSST